MTLTIRTGTNIMDEKHLVWAFAVLVLCFAGEPDLMSGIITYLTAGGR